MYFYRIEVKNYTEKKRSTIKVILISLLSVFLIGILISTFATEYYVSLTGNDQNPGIKEQPFRTIQKAADVMSAGDICYIREGRYRQRVTISSRSQLTFKAYQNEHVILDGTIPISGTWTKYKDSIYKTKLTNDVWQLFVDGKMMTSARWPNAPAWREEMWSRESWARQHSSSTYGHMVDDETWKPENTLAGQGVSFNGAIAILNIGYWETWARLVENHIAGNNSFDYQADCLSNEKYFGKHDNLYGSWYFLEGSLQCLDTAEEWYFNPETKELYLWADGGNNPTGRQIHGKTQTYAMDISKSSYITISGIDFFTTTFKFTTCIYMTVENCELLYPSYSKRMLKVFNPPEVTMLKSLSKSYIGSNIIRNCLFEYTDGAALEIWGRGNIIENCYFHDIDYSCVGSWKVGTISSWDTQSLTFRRNVIHTAGNSETIAAGESCLLEYNNIYNCGLVQGDGAIMQFTPKHYEGSVIRYNWTHNTSKRGIRLDGGGGPPNLPGYKATIHHNVTWECEWQGIMVKGDENYVYHNSSFDNNNIDLCILVSSNQNAINDNTITQNNAVGNIARSHGNPNSRPIPGIVSNNWIGTDQGQDIRTQLRDPDNLDFRPQSESDLIDTGLPIATINDGYIGNAPDIGAYEYGDRNYWLPGRILEKASVPIPPDGGTRVKTDADLMWLAGRDATAFEVYFGTNSSSLTKRSVQDNNIFDPGDLLDGKKYYWRIDCITPKGKITGDIWSFTVADSLTDIIDQSIAPYRFQLYQNYPNPFNSTTTITFSLKERTHVKLKLYNLLGELVETMIDEEMLAGKHDQTLDVIGFASGVYIYRLETEKYQEAKKCLLLK